MTTIEAATDTNCTPDHVKLLEEIHTAATMVLNLVPMDTDKPHVHLGVRALMARAIEIAEALQDVVQGKRTIPHLARLIPGASGLEPTRLHLDLLVELDVTGDAALAIVRASGVEPIDVQFFVACLQSRAGMLHDGWHGAISAAAVATGSGATSLPAPQPDAAQQ